MDKYEDIINIKHFEPKHKRMSILNRASQFAPFAALTGYEDNIKEAGRITNKKICLTNEEKILINNILVEINNNIKEKHTIKVVYFIDDLKKSGGKYAEYIGVVKVIDEYNKFIKFIDNKVIKINNIIKIEII